MKTPTLCTLAVAAVAALVPALGFAQVVSTNYRTTDHHGNAGAALAFLGHEQVIIPDSILPIGGDARTLSLWFRTTEATGAHTIVNWGTPTHGARFGLTIDAGHVKFVGESADLTSQRTFTDGAWHHAAVTYAGGATTLFVDGAIEARGQFTLFTQGTTLVIGNAVPGHAPEIFVGAIADLVILGHALTPAQIVALSAL